MTDLEREMCQLVLTAPEHEIGEPCVVHELYTALGEALRKEPNSRVISALFSSLYDDGRACPIPYGHHKAKRLLSEEST